MCVAIYPVVRCMAKGEISSAVVLFCILFHSYLQQSLQKTSWAGWLGCQVCRLFISTRIPSCNFKLDFLSAALLWAHWSKTPRKEMLALTCIGFLLLCVLPSIQSIPSKASGDTTDEFSEAPFKSSLKRTFDWIDIAFQNLSFLQVSLSKQVVSSLKIKIFGNFYYRI